MRSRVTAAVPSLLTLLLGCGGAGSPAGGAPRVEGPAAELVGAWISTATQERFGSPCPWIIEIFADGSAETNHLSDDRGTRCVFARVPYEIDARREPRVLRVGGQMSQCIYERQGERLRLICEDLGTPEPDDEYWLDFEPLEVERETSLKGLVGTWLAGAFMGATLIATIDRDGSFTPNVDEGSSGDGLGRAKIEIVDEERLVLRAENREERCLYRATRHRLTLRCQPAAAGWPGALYEPDAEPETMVLYRLSTEVEKSGR